MPSKQELAKTSLRGSVTESAANTFTQVTVDTNLGIRGSDIFVMTGIWFETNANLSANGDQFVIQLAYSTQSAIIQVDDADWLVGAKWAIEFTTSGGSVWDQVKYVSIDHFPIAVQNLFLGVQGTSLGSAARGSFKIEGYHVKVSTTEFFRLAQSR